MSTSPVQMAVGRILRPLEFAARDDYAHLDRVRDLEATLHRACSEALGLGMPRDLREVLEAMRDRFDGPLDPITRVEVVRKALEALEPCRDPGWGEALLRRPVSVLPGIGPKRVQAFEKRDLGTIGDLLFHLPARYEDRRSLIRIGDLEVGRQATFIAEVRSVRSTTRQSRGRHRRVLEAVVADDSGSTTLKWFRTSDALESMMKPGVRLLVSGDVRRYRFSKELTHPDIDPIAESDATSSGNEDANAQETGAAGPGAPGASSMAELRRVVPDYITPEGVPPRTLRRLIQCAVEEYADLCEGVLPESLVAERALPAPADALRAVHDPDPSIEIDDYARFASAAHERLVLEELYLLELGLLLRRGLRSALPGIAIDVDRAAVRDAPERLPFRLTDAQRRVWGEIRGDLARPHPMSRLVQGDVGCGKTAVALLAAAAVAASGRQTALMAPTELLAEQHHRTLESIGGALMSPSLRSAALTASVPRARSREIQHALAEGDIDLVVGTHALLQKDVAFHDLALAIIDEQHRFGVRQRAALAEKAAGGLHPHTLVMTATPIPRTLALTLYGDLEISTIDELPPGRSPVNTLLFREGEGRRVAELVRETASRGEQIYVVYPLVEESERIDLRSAMESAERIRAAFPAVRVDLVHGRLDSEQRNAAMRRFMAGETQILVSTTVIEVGVDVPNATLMVVEHAERFGLAQLHQLRGRVGRGSRPGTCLLVARGTSEEGEARLSAMLETTDGFRIADADLRIRGPGDFIGTRQSGALPSFRVVDLIRDARLIAVARRAADAVLQRDPELRRQPDLLRAIDSRWGDRLALIDVG